MRPALGSSSAGYLKFNVDGGLAKTTDKGGYAAVCRTVNGEYHGSSVVSVDGLTDPGILEALACLEALALAQDINARCRHCM